MTLPKGVTQEQVDAIHEEAAAIREYLGIPAPPERRVGWDARLVSLFYNPNHDSLGRFTFSPGGRGGGFGGRAGRRRRSTSAERKAAREKKTNELIEKWGEKFRPSIDNMTEWMEEFTPEEAQQRRERLAEAVDKLPDTKTANSVIVNGEIKGYTADRLAKHDALIEDYKKMVGWDDIPANREAILSGGLGGAGKGTMLHAMDINEKQYITIDPDGLKGLMNKHGLIPSPKSMGLDGFDPPIKPMEFAGLIHEESSDLSKRVAAMAMREGKNVILDNTMGSNSVFKKVTELKSGGYTVDGVFVDVSVDMSVESALARHMNGVASRPEGGRFVDPRLAAGQAPENPDYRSANRERFEKIQPELKSAVVIDNEAYAQRPAKIAASTWESLSLEAQRFVLRNLRSGKTQTELIEQARALY